MSLLSPLIDAGESARAPCSVSPTLLAEGWKPRPYQLELFSWAICSQNAVCFLPTGTGKTLVGALALASFARANPGRKLLFVVDKVPLLHQQAAALRTATGLQVLELCGGMQLARVLTHGSDSGIGNAADDVEESRVRDFDVLAVTAQKLLNCLDTGELSIQDFALVVIDEVHHATGGNHPFRVLLQQHLQLCPERLRPHLLGLTASPLTEGQILRAEAEESFGGSTMLEDVTGAKLCIPVKYREAFEKACTLPETTYITRAESSAEARAEQDLLHRERGGAVDQVINLLNTRFSAGPSSRVRAIVFARTIADAKALLAIFREHLASRVNPQLLVGHSEMSWERGQKAVLQQFRDGGTQLLVCTSVLEEGIDVSECNLVVRMDGQMSLRSYIQSRGRARAKDSAEFVLVCTDTERAVLRRTAELEGSMLAILVRRVEKGSLAKRKQVEELAEKMVQLWENSVPTVAVPQQLGSSVVEALDTSKRSLHSVGICVPGGAPGFALDNNLLLQLFTEFGRVVGQPCKASVEDTAASSVIVQIRLAKEYSAQLIRGQKIWGVQQQQVESHGFLQDLAQRASAGRVLAEGGNTIGPLWFANEAPLRRGNTAGFSCGLEHIRLGHLQTPSSFRSAAGDQHTGHGTCPAFVQCEVKAPHAQARFELYFDVQDYEPIADMNDLYEWFGDLLDDITTIRVRHIARIDFKDVAFAIVNQGTLLVALQRPPTFFKETSDDSRTVRERTSLDKYRFALGSFLTWSLGLGLGNVYQAAACLERSGVRVYHACVEDQAHVRVPCPDEWDGRAFVFCGKEERVPFLDEWDSCTFPGEEERTRRAETVDTCTLSFETAWLLNTLIGERPLLGPHLDVNNRRFALWRSIVNPLEQVVQRAISEGENWAAGEYWPRFFAAETFLRARVAAVFPGSGRVFPCSQGENPPELPDVPRLVESSRVLHGATPSDGGRTDIVFVAAATPTRVKLKAPEATLSNRVVRNFGRAGFFLRVRLCDEEEASMSEASVLRASVETVFGKVVRVGDQHSEGEFDESWLIDVEERALDRQGLVSEGGNPLGIRIGPRRFYRLWWSNSQMRTGALWLFSRHPRSPVTVRHIREWVGDLTPLIEKPFKYACRLALAFSSTLPMFDVTFRVIEDIEREGFCFTDGAGFVSPQCAARVAEKLGLNHTPSSFQIRLGGCKGVITVNPDYHYEGHDLILRRSQEKFKSTYRQLEIISWAQFYPAHLNQQIIQLLSAREVPDEAILRAMRRALKKASSIVTDPAVAASVLREMKLGVSMGGKDARKLVLKEPFFRSLLQYKYALEVTKLKQKTAIPISEGANVLGVPDDRCCLGEREVFIQVCTDEGDYNVITGPVFVVRNPCLHPGDLLLVHAVDKPALHHIRDCVVFPTVGARPLPDESSGGDLDGDKFTCIWQQDLVPTSHFPPMNFSEEAAAAGAPAKADMGGQKRPGLELDPTRAKAQRMAKLEEDTQTYYLNCISSTDLGLICNAHKVLSDREGATSQGCIELAKLASDAVDAPKTGKKVVLGRDKQPEKYPRWMEKRDKESYYEPTILQRCYELCPKLDLHTFFGLDKDGSNVQLEEEAQNTPICSVKRNFVNKCFCVAGYQRFVNGAERLFREYCQRLRALMRCHGVKHEAELYVGTIEVHRGYSLKDRVNQSETVRKEMTAIRKHYRLLFFKEEGEEEAAGGHARAKPESVALEGPRSASESGDWVEAKAYAWYITAYECEQRKLLKQRESVKSLFLSFGWIMSDVLLRIYKRRAEGMCEEAPEQVLVTDEEEGVGSAEVPEEVANEDVYVPVAETILAHWQQARVIERAELTMGADEKLQSVSCGLVLLEVLGAELEVQLIGRSALPQAAGGDEPVAGDLVPLRHSTPKDVLDFLRSQLADNEAVLESSGKSIKLGTAYEGARVRFELATPLCPQSFLQEFLLKCWQHNRVLGRLLGVCSLLKSWGERTLELSGRETNLLLLLFLISCEEEEEEEEKEEASGEIELLRRAGRLKAASGASAGGDGSVMSALQVYEVHHSAAFALLNGSRPEGGESPAGGDQRGDEGRYLLRFLQKLEGWTDEEEGAAELEEAFAHFVERNKSVFPGRAGVDGALSVLAPFLPRPAHETRVVSMASVHFSDVKRVRQEASLACSEVLLHCSVHVMLCGVASEESANDKLGGRQQRLTLHRVPPGDQDWIAQQLQSAAATHGATIVVRAEQGVRGTKLILDVTGSAPALSVIRGIHLQLRAMLAAGRKTGTRAMSALDTLWVSANEPQLRVYQQREQILQMSSDNRVLILTGATGCGKSTGVPKLLLEGSSSGLSLKRILCTQPRRIAACSLARHVAELSQTRLGDKVGYSIGGAHEYKRGKTELLYMTTAIAMYQFLEESVPYTHLIIDEVHERSIYVDILLALVKLHHLKRNVNLRVILMSAAADCDNLSRYFLDSKGQPAPILRLDAPTPYKIEEKCLEDLPYTVLDPKVRDFSDALRRHQRSQEVRDFSEAMNSHQRSALGLPFDSLLLTQPHVEKLPAPVFPLDALVRLIVHLDRQMPHTARFLVFLPGRVLIDSLEWKLDDAMPLHGEDEAWLVQKLHSGMSVEQQMRILQGGAGEDSERRQIILATDIVETSVTIPECQVIFDTCVHRRKVGGQLMNQLVCADEVLQRRGRTGRTCPGTVYRLVPQDVLRQLEVHPPPEMQQASVNLAHVLLALQEGLRAGPLAMSLGECVDPRRFLQACPAPPNPRSVDRAFGQLLEAGAITDPAAPVRHPHSLVAGQSGLTHLGRLTKEITLDLDCIRLVHNGLRYGVLEEAETMAAIMNHRKTPFLEEQVWPAEKQQVCRIKMECSTLGEPLARLRAVQVWERENRRRWKNGKPDNSEKDLLEEEEFCWKHYLSHSALQEIQESRVHIRQALVRLGLAQDFPQEFLDSVGERGAKRRRIEARRKQLPQACARELPYDPAQAICRLVGELKEQEGRHGFLSAEEKEMVLQWLLVSTFPQNVITLEVKTMNAPLQITYSSRKSNSEYGKRKRRKKHYQEQGKRSLQQDVSSSQHLEWFLREYLRLNIERCDSTEDRQAQTMNHRVTFKSRKDFHLALNLTRSSSAEYPYTKADFRDYAVTFRRECYSEARGNMIVTTDGACDLFTGGGVTGCVAGAVLPTTGEKGHNSFLCVDLTKVPSQLHKACDEATGPVWPRPTFCGVPETTAEVMCEHLRSHEQSELRQLINSIRKNLDKEFGMVGERRSDVVVERAHQVVRVVHLLQQEEQRGWAQQWQASSTAAAVVVKDFRIPPGKAGFVIGKGGSTIKRMRAETGAKIEVAKDGVTVALQGTQAQIRAAEMAIRRECRMDPLPMRDTEFDSLWRALRGDY